MFNIIIHKQAKKKLQALSSNIRARIAEHIYILGQDPEDNRLDIKKLRGVSGFRLRIGQWRIIFERNDILKIISIEKIGTRGDIYK